MHWWGLTIDTVTCIQLVLAIGLAVDYSAHIGHTFMTVTGDRNGKAYMIYYHFNIKQGLQKLFDSD